QLGTDLRINWNFNNATVDPADNNATFGFAPTVSFNNSTVDLSTFFHQFAAPVLGTIGNVTSPFKPVIDVLTDQINLLAKLGFSKTTLLDFLGVPADSVAVIKGLADIVTLSDLANGFGGAATIDLGSLSVLGDLRVT